MLSSLSFTHFKQVHVYQMERFVRSRYATLTQQNIILRPSTTPSALFNELTMCQRPHLAVSISKSGNSEHQTDTPGENLNSILRFICFA